MHERRAGPEGVTEKNSSSRRAFSGVMTEVEDRRLIARLRAGEPAAFDEVYARHAGPIYSFLRRLSRRADLAEDLAQETWLRFARATPTLPVDTKAAPYLYTIARNAFLSHRRWAALDLSRLFLLGLEAATVRVPDLHEARENTEAVERLEVALGEVSAAARELLLLVGVDELDHADVAAMLRVSPDTLRKRIQRARHELRTKLERLPARDSLPIPR